MIYTINMKIIIFIIFWLIGGIINCFTNKQIRDYKDYANPKLWLTVIVLLSFVMSWTLIHINIIYRNFYLPSWLYHNCNENSTITFEDYDYDKDGNLMKEYNAENFGHRETYKVYTCKICGKITKERLQ